MKHQIYFAKMAIAALLVGAAIQCGFAQEIAAPSKDLVDLLNEKKIEVKTEGNGISSVDLMVRNKGSASLNVKIPVGTFFVAANHSSQNMVTTEESAATLADQEWHTVSVSTACANRPRHIPESGDKFVIMRAPNQKELAQLMPVLDKAQVDYQTRQAAVWMVTDDADFNDLGILVASRNGVNVGRVINEPEAAMAMKIYDEAGLNLKRKAIWGDRRRILSALADGDVKQWLQQKIRESAADKKR